MATVRLRNRKPLLVSAVVAALAFGKNGAVAPTIAATPAPLPHVSLTVGGPVNVAEGSEATVPYSLQNLGSTSAVVFVVGLYNGKRIPASGAIYITVGPSATINGNILVPNVPLGASKVIVSATLPIPCGPPVIAVNGVAPSPCPAPVLSQDAVTLIGYDPHVRIGGNTYEFIQRSDPTAQLRPYPGYLYVAHDPGCGRRSPPEKSGVDQFFYFKQLPDGASIDGADLAVYWPPKLTATEAAGNASGIGRYGAKLSTAPGGVFNVTWYATCKKAYAKTVLRYSISFRITAPRNSDFGEPAPLASQVPSPPIIPDGYQLQPSK